MTFKQLTLQLQREGWRAYYIPHSFLFIRKNLIKKLENIHLKEILVYEGEDIVFVKTIQMKPIRLLNDRHITPEEFYILSQEISSPFYIPTPLTITYPSYPLPTIFTSYYTTATAKPTND